MNIKDRNWLSDVDNPCEFVQSVNNRSGVWHGLLDQLKAAKTSLDNTAAESGIIGGNVRDNEAMFEQLRLTRTAHKWRI